MREGSGFHPDGPVPPRVPERLTRASEDAASASPRVQISDRRRLYVIGDIHGRSDLLDRMADEITRDLESDPADACTVTLGDYVDRGADSRGVVDRLVRNPFSTDHFALKGNHEALLEQFMREPAIGEYWTRLGGLETLRSYGIAVDRMMTAEDYDRAAEALRTALPESHADFLASLAVSLTFDRFFLCHAGVRPGVPLALQQPHDLMWIRDQFLTSTADFGKIVVHGHTPTDEPQILPNRINVDTRAFRSGRLTCAVLDAGPVRFLSTR